MVVIYSTCQRNLKDFYFKIAYLLLNDWVRGAWGFAGCFKGGVTEKGNTHRFIVLDTKKSLSTYMEDIKWDESTWTIHTLHQFRWYWELNGSVFMARGSLTGVLCLWSLCCLAAGLCWRSAQLGSCPLLSSWHWLREQFWVAAPLPWRVPPKLYVSLLSLYVYWEARSNSDMA